MRKEYEDIVRNVCRLTNWKAAPLPERQGAIGVACVLAYLRGVKAGSAEMASHIGVPENEVAIPFKRLQVNGVFSSKMDIRNDAIFEGKGEDKVVYNTTIFTISEQTQNAWAYIAGLAGGLCGLRETVDVNEANDEVVV